MSNIDYKLLKFAEEVNRIPALKSYVLGSNDIDVDKVGTIINKFVNFENNNAYNELVSLVMLIINTEKVLENE